MRDVFYLQDGDRGRPITQARDPDKAARAIEAGAVYVNRMMASDPRLPFGGIKESGYGRELSVFGVREFVNVKTVWVK